MSFLSFFVTTFRYEYDEMTNDAKIWGWMCIVVVYIYILLYLKCHFVILSLSLSKPRKIRMTKINTMTKHIL
jgi:hypothetical protein